MFLAGNFVPVFKLLFVMFVVCTSWYMPALFK